ncbi:hypothetical protein QUB80_20915 [Chlorogloeopsis sp. ULAP01]|nr:hypothetical protein [Chlorogloeopsis sp. ULAP01]MDM9383159.1 hypothetical protein [Chlorogloeopsis sp. ULAP01]
MLIKLDKPLRHHRSDEPPCGGAKSQSDTLRGKRSHARRALR